MDETAARTVLTWEYPSPYDFYNADQDDLDEDIESMLQPAYQYHSIWSAEGELIGLCCFGEDAQVTGGEYGQPALDIGASLRPDLTGRGNGHAFVAAIIDFAQITYAPAILRVTVAAFNQRAERVWQKLGFQVMKTFVMEESNVAFNVLVRSSA